MLQLPVSFFARATDNAPRPGTVAFPDGWNDFIRAPVDPARLGDDAYLKGCKDVRLWSPATFNGTRRKANVLSLCALVIDYDGKGVEGMDPGELMDRWAKYAHVLHSTFTPGRYRIILPYDRPITPAEHERVFAWVVQREGLDLIDGGCKDASRMFYWPTVREHVGRPDLDVQPVFGYNEGERLGVGGADLQSRTPPSRSTSFAPSPPVASRYSAGTDAGGGGADNPYAGIDRAEQREDLALIESRCAFMRHVRADAHRTHEDDLRVTEPEWYAGLSIIARCVGGDDIAHEVSSPYPGYDYDVAETKYQRAKSESGPRTCRDIRLLSSACAGCPLQVTSPVLLGRSSRVQQAEASESPASAGPPAPHLERGDAPTEDLEAAVAEAQAAFDQARVDEDAAHLAVETAKKRLRYLRSPTAIASDEDTPAAIKALGEAQARLRAAQRARTGAERRLAAARARTAVAGLPPGADPVVWQRLRIEPQGRPAASLGNVLAILDGDPRWSSRFAYDSFSLDVCVDRNVLPEELGTALTAKLAYDYGLETKTELVLECMRVVAKRRPFHPVKEWLSGLTWDGTPRMADLMHRGFGAAPTEDDGIVRAVGEQFLLSMVARVCTPGAKVDTMLVLVGKQGAKKSTSLEALVGEEWFGSTKLDLLNKDSYMMLRGKWLYEVAEFDSMRRVEASTSKAWLSNAKDTYRAPYAKRAEDHRRQTVMAGTTNEDEFLMDPTGWRRYRPVAVTSADLAWLAANRTQLFAEAVARYNAGEKWWFDENTEEAARLQKVTSTFQVTHPWAEVVYQYVLGRKTEEPFSAVDVMRTALGRQTGDLTHGEKTLVGQILRHQVQCPTVKGPSGTLYRRPGYMPPAASGVLRVAEAVKVLPYAPK